MSSLNRCVITAAIIFFWICVFISGQPAPFDDDIFYAGAAINFAKHGVMYNPQLRLTFPFLTHFYVYPPIEQFALGYWLKLWGVSTKSVLSFFMVCNMVTSLAALRLVAYFKLHPINILISVLLVANTVLFLGLRVEAFGLACISTGIVFVLTKFDRYYCVFIGSFLAVIGSISAPSFSVPGILWFLTVCYFSFRREANSTSILTWFFLGSIAAALVFLGSINFELSEFLRAFLFHARLSFHPPTLGLVVILLGIAIAACASSDRLRLTAIALGITTLSFLIHSGPTGWEPLFLVCVTAIIALETLLSEKPRWAMVLRSVFLVTLVIIAMPWLGYALHYLLDPPSQAKLESLAKSKALVSTYESLGKSIAIDPFVARKYFDFRIPDRAVDWYSSLLVPDIDTRYKLREDVSEEGINGVWLLDSFMLQDNYSAVDRLGFEDIRQAALNSRKEVSTVFEWWRARVFEKYPLWFTKTFFFGQRFIRFYPLGGWEDPILIDIESKKLYRGQQLIFKR